MATLLESRSIPNESWLTEESIDDVFSEAAHYHELAEKYWSLVKLLEPQVEAEFFHLTEDGIHSVLSSYGQISKYLLEADEKGVGLLANFELIPEFIDQTSATIKEIDVDLMEIEKAVSLDKHAQTMAEVIRNTQFVLLVYSDHKPERSWIDTRFLREIKGFLGEYALLCTEYNTKRQSINAQYELSVYDVDVPAYLSRFESILYSSFLRFLNPGFYQVKKEMTRHSRNYNPPADIRADLLTLRSITSLKDKIDALRQQAVKLLESYYNGPATDFFAVNEALQVAEATLAVNDGLEVPESVKAKIAVGGVLPGEIKQHALNVKICVEAWQSKAERLGPVLNLSNPTRSGKSIWNETFSRLLPWTENFLPVAQRFGQNIAPILREVKSKPKDWLELQPLLSARLEQVRIQSLIDSESNRLRQQFGQRFAGLDTSWDEILKAIKWTMDFRQSMAGRPISPATQKFVTSNQSATLRPEEIRQACYRFEEAMSTDLLKQFEPDYPRHQDCFIKDLPLSDMLFVLVEMRRRLTELDDWIGYRNVRQQILSFGLASLMEAMEKDPPQQQDVPGLFDRSFYGELISHYFHADPRLTEFKGQDHEIMIADFRRLDRELLNLAPYAVMECCKNNRPSSSGIAMNGGEASVLKAEAGKMRRHMPIYKLFQKMPNLLTRLKPCLMMSPLSVSQFISPDCFKFDLIIFDEASQIFTEDAVVAIYRGKQVVIAGDSKQMPPTNFFRSMESGDDEYEEENPENGVTLSSADYGSVLDECKTFLPEMMLRWHYRSRHESLIAFSNHQFYAGKLVTFPSSLKKSDDLGLKLIHVPDGVYERGGRRINIREAEVVADLVMEHYRRHPAKSIGVVAFSQAQMNAVEDILEERRKSHPELEPLFREDRLEGFFVKNLENVQGDERDVIVFSVGYGKDQHGRVSMNFGPLNKTGGERRLNVAVTRARFKVLLVSSIKAADIDIGNTNSEGVLNLYKYLQYAEMGEQALEISHPNGMGDFESPFEEDVAAEIRPLGYDVICQVGCSGYRIDLGVVSPEEPGKFILGVECDGASYHSATTARDRDRLRQQVLEQMGWRIHRIWSPDWFFRRDKTIEQLKIAIIKAKQQGKEKTNLASSMPATSIVVNYKPLQEVEHNVHDLAGAKLYKEYKLMDMTNWNSGLEFHDPYTRQKQAKLIDEVVTAEGPIHVDLVAKRLAAAWGLTRVGARMQKCVLEACYISEQNGKIRKKGDFLWPVQFGEIVVRKSDPLNPTTIRDIEHIPTEELGTAMKLIIHDAVGMSPEILLQETSRLFGFNRNGEKIRQRMSESLSGLIQKKEVIQTGDSVTLPNGK